MKKMYILALVAATMAFSCNKNVVEQAPVQEPVLRTFTCTIAEPDTKLAIDDATGITTWEEGDEILFHGKYAGGAYSTVVTLAASDISADRKSFTVTVPEFTNGADQAKWASSSANYSASNIFALYPASAATMVDSGSTNWYNKNFFGETNHPLMSAFNDGYDSNSFTFYNLCGILSFIVTGDYDSYVLSGNNDETVSYTKYTSRLYKKTDDTINTDWVYTEAGKDYSTAVKTISGTVNNGTETRIFIPGGVTFSGGFTIHFIKSGDIVKELSTTKAVSVPRNSYRPMGNVTTYLKDYVAPTSHGSSIDMTGATELDASGNANCYIVDGSVAGNANKVFTFKAYKGNSTTGVGTVASAEILWETWNNAETVTANSVIAAVDFDKQEANDYYTMVFKMPATLHAGNALIAAKDAGDNILWSWHIWVPETSVTADATGVGGMAQAGILDRNLGALVVTSPSAADASIQSAGLMYQWGRKDPFMGPSAFGTNSAATVNGTAKTNVTEQKTEAWTIQNPTVFIAYNGDWSTVVNNDIWADSDATAKSISDPCPPGYRVPQRTTSLRLWSGTSLVGEASWELDAIHYWFKVGTPKPVVFPIAGYIYRSGGYDQSGTEAYIWTAHKGSDTIAYALRLKSDGTTKNEQPVKASGANVRCVGIAE